MSHTPKTVSHDDLDSFVNAIADCREAGGDLISCDNPRYRLLAYIHHPDEGDPVIHEITLRNVSGTVVSDGVAARLGMTPDEVRTHLGTYEGRYFLATGHHDTTPGNDDDLRSAMLADHLQVNLEFDPETNRVVGVDFPDTDLGVVGATPREYNFRAKSPRPAWLPEGWSSFRLPDDAARVGVSHDPVRDASGYFARRGDWLFRAFDTGAWDVSLWYTHDDAGPTEYRVDRAGVASDGRAAVEAVLPHYRAIPPAVVRGGAP